jgi:hypothetical protein
MFSAWNGGSRAKQFAHTCTEGHDDSLQPFSDHVCVCVCVWGGGVAAGENQDSNQQLQVGRLIAEQNAELYSCLKQILKKGHSSTIKWISWLQTTTDSSHITCNIYIREKKV